jgi:hypothetical protein
MRQLARQVPHARMLAAREHAQSTLAQGVLHRRSP